MIERQHTPEELTAYEVAREAIGRQIGALLRAEDAEVDQVERDRLAGERRRLVHLRVDMTVGSATVAQVLDEARAAHQARIGA